MRPDETKARILAATDQLFGDLGFDATTTRDIAERSGVNKALIHYHFGSKDELLDGAARRLLRPPDHGARWRRWAGGRQLEEQAMDVLDAYADFLAGNRTFCSIVQREVASGRHVERIVEGTLPIFQLGDAVARAARRRRPGRARARPGAHQRLRHGGDVLHLRPGAAAAHREGSVLPGGARGAQAPRPPRGRRSCSARLRGTPEARSARS